MYKELLQQMHNDDKGAFDAATDGGFRTWIVFDGPVDAAWVESLNSVLDDTQVLCLANGERIKLLPTCHLMFEASELSHASPATISRCGMVLLIAWVRGRRLLTYSPGLCASRLGQDCSDQHQHHACEGHVCDWAAGWLGTGCVRTAGAEGRRSWGIA